MNRIFKRSAATVALVTALYIVLPPSISLAATHVDLGTAASFGVLAPTITNTGPTLISGTAGNFYGGFGGPAPTGFPPGVAGILHNNDALGGAALTAAAAAKTSAGLQPAVGHVLVPNETLTPGAYAIGTSALLSGSLTLNGGGDPSAIFVFTAPDSLTTASASTINLIGNAQACNVFWSIGSSATLGTGSTFVGHVVAQASITATTGAHIVGSLHALTGAITLDNNTVTNDNCAAVVVVPPVVVPPVVVPPVVVPPVVVPGTIHVIKVVNNTYGGTATPGDFTLTLRHWGVDVVGSPAVGVADPGRTYILAPGTYVLGEGDSAAFPDYIHSFDIAGQTSQNVVLHSGENLTIVQTNNQLPPLIAPVTPVTPVTPPPPTVSGGVLPKTATPWFNMLLLGLGAMLVGGVSFGLKKSSKI